MWRMLLPIMALPVLTACTAAAQPLELWYRSPAAKWTDALPIGNGRLGAMVFAGVEEDRIQFNEETLWTGHPRAHDRPGAHRYLDTIRKLLWQGRQREAEELAGREFMGLRSDDSARRAWRERVRVLPIEAVPPSQPGFDDRRWATLQVPTAGGWEKDMPRLDGAVWHRTWFDLPASWQGRDLTLDLGIVRDEDQTYVNGRRVGGLSGDFTRTYTVPASALRPGRNLVAVLVLNFERQGGLLGHRVASRPVAIFPAGAGPAERIDLSGRWRISVVDSTPPAPGFYQASYQPFGDVMLRFGHAGATDYRRSLDIGRAVASTRYRHNGIAYTREYLVSHPGQALVVRLSADRKAALSFEASLSSPHAARSVRFSDGRTCELSVRVHDGALFGKARLRISLHGGRLRQEGGRLVVTGADTAVLTLVAATNYRNYRDVSADPDSLCTAALSAIEGSTYAALRSAHEEEYARHFGKLSISLGRSVNEALPTDERLKAFAAAQDPSFVALYLQYGRYLLISSSRPGTRPANLQGIWNDLLDPPWGSKYTANINVQMNYWPAEPLNLSPMHEPLFDMVGELAETGGVTARRYYDAPGWVLHHNTDLWRATAAINASNHGIWVTGGAWLCHHLWERFLFTRDTVFLRTRAYPLMREAARFFQSFLVEDPETGALISTPSNSPEQGGLVAGPTMDHQIIRTLFRQTAEAAGILGTDSRLRTSLTEMAGRIAPNRIGRHGQLQEWMQDVDEVDNHHRHVSHLWGAYPGSEINRDDTPELLKAARQSLLYRGDAATGWSLGWKINLWARFLDGDHAYGLIRMLLSPAGERRDGYMGEGAGSYVNLFDAHPPFQIDGNFGGAAGIAELLVQSHTRHIDILPALPSALPEGDVRGLCARGGFELDLRWRGGRLERLAVRSLAGHPLRLRMEGRVVETPTVKGGRYVFGPDLVRLPEGGAD